MVTQFVFINIIIFVLAISTDSSGRLAVVERETIALRQENDAMKEEVAALQEGLERYSVLGCAFDHSPRVSLLRAPLPPVPPHAMSYDVLGDHDYGSLIGVLQPDAMHDPPSVTVL